MQPGIPSSSGRIPQAMNLATGTGRQWSWHVRLISFAGHGSLARRMEGNLRVRQRGKRRGFAMHERTCMAIVVLLASIGCGHQIKAPTMPDGNPIALYLHINENLDREDITEERARQLVQLLNWMEPDLEKNLKNAGYVVSWIDYPEEAIPAPGRYLLNIRFLGYDPGHAGLRVFSALGAGLVRMGEARLTIEYELSGASGIVLADRRSENSVKGWKTVCRALNLSIVEAISDTLARQ